MIDLFAPATEQETALIKKVLHRSGRRLPRKPLRVAFDRQGRFTVCLLRNGISPIAWGAARVHTLDTDDPHTGRQIALAKAARMLAERTP